MLECNMKVENRNIDGKRRENREIQLDLDESKQKELIVDADERQLDIETDDFSNNDSVTIVSSPLTIQRQSSSIYRYMKTSVLHHRTVMNSVVQAVVPLLHITPWVLFFMIIYAILGLELFCGKLHATCYIKETNTIPKTGKVRPCSLNGGRGCPFNQECRNIGWEGPWYGIISFDNFGLAMLSVFQCITMEGWTSILYRIHDVDGQNWAWIYFFSLIIISVFFTINLIFGVISGVLSKRQREAQQCDEQENQTLDQAIESTTDRNCHENIRHRFRTMIQSKPFHIIIIVLILMNTILIASEHVRQPFWLTSIQNIGNRIFVSLFALEMLLKIYAFGIKNYFISTLNRFDFIVIICAIIECILITLNSISPLNISILRCVHLLFIMKMTRFWATFQCLNMLFINSLKSIISLFVFVVIFMVFLALCGWEIFAVKSKEQFEEHKRNKFDSIWHSFVTVFQIFTGEEWNEVFVSTIYSVGGLGFVGIGTCFYFIVLIIFGMYILPNIILAIIVDNATDQSQTEAIVEIPLAVHTRRLPQIVKGLRFVVKSVNVTIKAIISMIIVGFLIQFIFACIGVRLFGGTFYSCTDLSKSTESSCKGNSLEIEDGKIYKLDREWSNAKFNFDNVPQALRTLFIVTTLEGWPSLSNIAVDSNAVDRGSIHNNRPFASLYFIIFIIVVVFVMINICLGFVVFTLEKEAKQAYRHCELNKNQEQCINFALKVEPIKRFIPVNKLRFKIWQFVTSQSFQNVIILFIILNTIVLATTHFNQLAKYQIAQDTLNIIFTLIFVIELILKMIAFGCRNFTNRSNAFDFSIIIGSILDILYSTIISPGSNWIRFNFFRLFRVMYLIKRKCICITSWTYIRSFRTWPYFVLLFGIFFSFYTIIGTMLFNEIFLDDYTAINSDNNFQTVYNTFFLLVRIATGESWHEIMHACQCDARFDVKDEKPCGSYIAISYFLSFYLIRSFLIFHMFVVLLMENFDYLTHDSSILGPHNLVEFVRLWSEYDPEATGHIKYVDLINLLRKTSPSFGFGDLDTPRLACKKLIAMKMPLNQDGTVMLNAALFSLIRTSLKIKIHNEQSNEELRNIILSNWNETPQLLLDQMVPLSNSNNEITFDHVYTTFLIQNSFRELNSRKAEAIQSIQSEFPAASNDALLFQISLRQLNDIGNEIRRSHSLSENPMSRAKDRSILSCLFPSHKNDHHEFALVDILNNQDVSNQNRTTATNVPIEMNDEIAEDLVCQYLNASNIDRRYSALFLVELLDCSHMTHDQLCNAAHELKTMRDSHRDD